MRLAIMIFGSLFGCRSEHSTSVGQLPRDFVPEAWASSATSTWVTGYLGTASAPLHQRTVAVFRLDEHGVAQEALNSPGYGVAIDVQGDQRWVAVGQPNPQGSGSTYELWVSEPGRPWARRAPIPAGSLVRLAVTEDGNGFAMGIRELWRYTPETGWASVGLPPDVTPLTGLSQGADGLWLGGRGLALSKDAGNTWNLVSATPIDFLSHDQVVEKNGRVGTLSASLPDWTTGPVPFGPVVASRSAREGRALMTADSRPGHEGAFILFRQALSGQGWAQSHPRGPLGPNGFWLDHDGCLLKIDLSRSVSRSCPSRE